MGHFCLAIFEGCSFAGQCLQFEDDCPFLQSQGWAKNCVNAIKVYGDGAWVLGEEPNDHGRMSLVERGHFCSFSSWAAHSAHPVPLQACQLARPEPGEAQERARSFLPLRLGTMENKRHQSGESRPE
ncbi:crystallin gamma N [Rhinolophus ferrumequinum]|uniref:Crystallin gamma N n=1 Tax=Rhinolophus ferrumequinum TaxID=59479 RepID=A0A7J7RIR0_RHIFE|nr:crystallin gamma N [Rhinolophus ferrumequinum]